MAPTQEALYRDIDLELSWSEGQLPERERTKHVHRLHPYLRDPAPGSARRAQATRERLRPRLVRAADRRRTARLPQAHPGVRARRRPARDPRLCSPVRPSHHAFRPRLPARPQTEPYWCHKHKRRCRPVETAQSFLPRYALDTLARIKEFARARRRGCEAEVLHGDSRELGLEGRFDGIVTSPPYPGLIDYHEQHRYAYELLGLDDRRRLEVGAAAGGTSRAALAAYTDGIVAALESVLESLRRGGPVLIVVNDRRDLYPAILERAGLGLEERLRRHVNRRTGRRAGEFFEDVLVARR